jgi:hypothetical protein
MQWTVVAIATRGGADGEGVSSSPASSPQTRYPGESRASIFVSDGSSSWVTKKRDVGIL